VLPVLHAKRYTSTTNNKINKPHWNEVKEETVRNDSWTNEAGTCRQVAKFLDDCRDHYHNRNRMIQESE